jgi:hypothetical protein
LETNSTDKSAIFRKVWQADVVEQPGRSLGGYAFLWGHKMEGTHTWFDMFLPDTEERLGPVDALEELWTGHLPVHPVPQILSLESDVGQAEIAAGSQHEVRVVARGDGLSYRWEIRGGGSEILWRGEGATVRFGAPHQAGAYRIFVYVSDSYGGAATANLPFFVTP